jgi:hypothetical protein
MQTSDIEYLKTHFYNPLFARLDEDNAIVHNSIIISLLPKTSNWRYNYLKEASRSAPIEDQDIIDILIGKKFIRVTDEHNRYQITASGVWEIENDQVGIDQLFSNIDELYFDVFSKNRPLTAKEKVALLSFIAARTFSEACPLDRRNGPAFLDNWIEIFRKSESFLLSKGIIKEPADLFDNRDAENAVAYLIRRLNNLTKKTRNIYKSRSSIAYLDLYDYEHEELQADGLAYLFWKIFGNELDADLQSDIFDFCSSINQEYKSVIFNPDQFDAHIFSRIEYDYIFQDALFKADVNKKSYEMREA